MHSILIGALFVAMVLAAPASRLAAEVESTMASELGGRGLFGDISSAVSSVGSDIESAASDAKNDIESVADKTIDGCDVAKCAIALGPAAVGCGSAVAQGGADPISDIGCLVAGLNDVANTPSACKPCTSLL